MINWCSSMWLGYTKELSYLLKWIKREEWETGWYLSRSFQTRNIFTLENGKNWLMMRKMNEFKGIKHKCSIFSIFSTDWDMEPNNLKMRLDRVCISVSEGESSGNTIQKEGRFIPFSKIWIIINFSNFSKTLPIEL